MTRMMRLLKDPVCWNRLNNATKKSPNMRVVVRVKKAREVIAKSIAELH